MKVILACMPAVCPALRCASLVPTQRRFIRKPRHSHRRIIFIQKSYYCYPHEAVIRALSLSSWNAATGQGGRARGPGKAREEGRATAICVPSLIDTLSTSDRRSPSTTENAHSRGHAKQRRRSDVTPTGRPASLSAAEEGRRGVICHARCCFALRLRNAILSDLVLT